MSHAASRTPSTLAKGLMLLLIVLAADILAQGWMILVGARMDVLRDSISGAELGAVLLLLLVGLRMAFGGSRAPASASQAALVRMQGALLVMAMLPAAALVMADIAAWRPSAPLAFAALLLLVLSLASLIATAAAFARRMDEFQRRNFHQLCLVGLALTLTGNAVWAAAAQLRLAPLPAPGDVVFLSLLLWLAAFVWTSRRFPPLPNSEDRNP